MTWQEFLDLTSAVGTSQHPPCLVLPRWVIVIGDDKQGLPLGDVLGGGVQRPVDVKVREFQL